MKNKRIIITVLLMIIFLGSCPLQDDFSTGGGIPAPTGLQVVLATPTSITITWNAVAGAVKYNIYSAPLSTIPNPVLIETVVMNYYTISDLTPNSTLYFRVSAVDINDIESPKSDYIEGRTLGQAIPVPPNVRANAVSSSSIQIDWNAVPGAASYKIFQSSSLTDPFLFIGESLTVSFTVTGLMPQTTYYYSVSALTANGESEQSEIAIGTTPAIGVVLPPAGLRVVSADATTISLTWNVMTGAVSYKIYRSTSSSDNFAEISSVAANSYTDNDSALLPATIYYYKVSSIYSTGESYQSNSISARLLAAPSAPLIAPIVNFGDRRLDITWEMVTDAISYEVWLGTTENTDSASLRHDNIEVLAASITGLTNGVTYYVWIKAKNNIGTSDFSPPGSGIPDAPREYTVEYNANGGTGTMNPQTFVIGVYQSLRLNSFTRSGHKFIGWARTPTGLVVYSDQESINGSDFSEGEIVKLYAVWEEPSSVVPGLTLNEKFNWLDTNAESNNAYIIELAFNEGLGPRTLSYSNRTDITIRLRGGNTMRTITLSNQGVLFTIGSGVTLILDNNITLQGRNTNNNYLIIIDSGGSLIMNTGSKITGNTRSVDVNANVNASGGVLVNGIFTMNGGEVSGITTTVTSASTSSSNTLTVHGSGINVNNGIFTMNDGSITGNNSINISTNNNSSSTFHAYGGGVFVASNGTFIMDGGEISNNVTSLSTNSNNTTNSRSRGGGVFINGGTFTMNDGIIYGNSAIDTTTSTSRSFGGGVFLNGGTFNMYGGTIAENKAVNGGGVSLSGGTFNMFNGTIIENTVVALGGGVYGEGATFNINNGIISGNTAVNTGGGVYLIASYFIKTGGIIYGYTEENTNSNSVRNSSGTILNNRGHGVYVIQSSNIKRMESDTGPEIFLIFDGRTANPSWSGDWEF